MKLITDISKSDPKIKNRVMVEDPDMGKNQAVFFERNSFLKKSERMILVWFCALSYPEIISQKYSIL